MQNAELFRIVVNKLSAFNNEYLVLDHYDSVNKHNIREIYKRVVE